MKNSPGLHLSTVLVSLILVIPPSPVHSATTAIKPNSSGMFRPVQGSNGPAMIPNSPGFSSHPLPAGGGSRGPAPGSTDEANLKNAARMIVEGGATFRSDTFGDEAFWGDALK